MARQVGSVGADGVALDFQPAGALGLAGDSEIGVVQRAAQLEGVVPDGDGGGVGRDVHRLGVAQVLFENAEGIALHGDAAALVAVGAGLADVEGHALVDRRALDGGGVVLHADGA